MKIPNYPNRFVKTNRFHYLPMKSLDKIKHFYQIYKRGMQIANLLEEVKRYLPNTEY